MSEGYVLTFRTVTALDVQHLKTDLRKSAVIRPKLNGDFSISTFGIEADVEFDPSQQSLAVRIFDKPAWLGLDEIRRQIEMALAKAKGR